MMRFNRSTASSLVIPSNSWDASRRSVLLLPAALLLASTLAVVAPRPARALEDATPVPSAGIERERLGQGESAAAPGRVLLLARRTFAPGADSGAHPADGPVVLYVESGAVAFEVEDGAALVTRAGATSTETVAAGDEVTLNAGDEVFYDEGVVHDVYNEGSVPAVTIEARLNPSVDAAMATPTT
jgi:quercetin dioxygenase-like cupin family protein